MAEKRTKAKRTAKPLPKPKQSDIVGRLPHKRVRITPREIAALESEVEAFKLKKKGYSYEEIGRKLGLSTSCVLNRVRAAYKRVLSEQSNTVDEERLLDLARLDDAIAVVMAEMTGDTEKLAAELKKAMNGGQPVLTQMLLALKGLPNPDMADKLVKLIAQRAKLLGTEKQPDENVQPLKRVYIGIDIDKV
jgi:hypothetical protein